jgi:arylsulfatase A-like enzyme
MTGLSDRNHQVEVDFFTLDPKRTTLAQNLQNAGYQTAGFFSGPYLDKKYGFARGFDIWRSAMMSPSDLATEISSWVKRRTLAGQPAPTEDEIRGIRDRVSHWDVTSPKVNQGALEFLHSRDENKPFFLTLHYFDAHYDYLPETLEKGLTRKFDPDYQGNFEGVNWYFNPDVRDQKPPYSRRISERDLGHVLSLYDAEIHWVDRHIGAIIQELKKKGLWDNTLVCIVADHGDEFFEHGMIGHRSTLFPELTSIPLLLKVPGAKKGSRIPKLARIYDIAPTLLDYAGVPPLKEAEGLSLRPFLEGANSPSRSILQRVPGGPDVRDGWRNDQFAIQRVLQIDPQQSRANNELRFQPRLTAQGQPMIWVFDRISDPKETRPLPQNDPRWAQAVSEFRSAFLKSEKHSRTLPLSPLSQRLTPKMSEEEEAMMEQLGYGDHSSDSSQGGQSSTLPLGPFPIPGN